jgi:hypothetical protein
MVFFVKRVFLLVLIITVSACIPGLYYFGFHGPSIRLTPEEHEGFTEDEECLECHGKESDPDEAPLSTHYGFHGCLKCHNDEVTNADLIKRSDNSDQNP